MFAFACNSAEAQIQINAIASTPAYEITGVQTGAGTLVVAYVQDRNPASPSDPTTDRNKVIAIKRSTNGGSTWAASTVIGTNPSFNYLNPDMVIDQGGDIYLIFSVIKSVNTSSELELWKSTNQGVSWTSVTTVYNTDHAILPRLAVSSSSAGRLYMVTTVMRKGGAEKNTLYLRTTDGGLTWKDSVSLSVGLGVAQDHGADITVIRGNRSSSIAVAWAETQGIRFASSSNATSFGAPNTVTNTNVRAPLILEFMNYGRKSNIGLMAHTPNKEDLTYYIKSGNRGSTWGIPAQIAQKATMACGALDSAGKVHMFYNELEFQVYRARRRETDFVGSQLSNPIDFFTPPMLTMSKWIGNYQKMIYGLQDNKMHLFWIDWRNSDAKPSHSSWKASNLGSEDLSYQELKAYPNPTEGRFRLNLEESPSNTELIIESIEGRLLRTDVINSANTEVDISDLPSGTYILRSINQKGEAKITRMLKL